MNFAISIAGSVFLFIGAFLIGIATVRVDRGDKRASVVMVDNSSDDELAKAVKAEVERWTQGRLYSVRIDHIKGDNAWDVAAVVEESTYLSRTLNTRAKTPIDAVQTVMAGLGLHRS